MQIPQWDMGIASYQHMYFKYNSYSHYNLGHHNVKVCSCRQAEYNKYCSNRQQCSQGTVCCVHKESR